MATEIKKPIVDRIMEFFLGVDDEDAVEGAIDSDADLEASGAVALRRPAYTVEVYYDKETQLFGARLKTKSKDIDVDAEGATPGEALSYTGMLIDTALVRRGFEGEKKP